MEAKKTPMKTKKDSMLLITLRRLAKNKMAMAGLAFILFMVVVAILSPWIAPYSYEAQDLDHVFSMPSKEHWFGTDNLGRDIFSRIMYGGRYSLRIGFISAGVAALGGVTLGSIAGYYGGRVDTVIMRILDVFQSVPSLLMSIAIAASLGPGFTNCIIALSVSTMPAYARMTRASFLNVREMEYVEAARSINAGDFRIIRKHVLPNAISPMLVQATMGVASGILGAAALSFLGLGVQPPEPEWGAMLSAGRNYIRDYWHVVLFPGITIMLTILSLNMLGDGLRDALDPRLKN